MQDRRKIGGISKDAYLHIVRQSGGNEAIASLDFDMRQCIMSKVELMQENCTCRLEQCEKRFDEQNKKIAKSGKVNMVISGGGGLIGGFLAVIAKAKFWG
jgi:hypothetical protein